MPPGKRKTLPVETSRHAFAYVFAGSGIVPQRLRPAGGADRRVGGRRVRPADEIGNRSLVLFDRGDEVTVQAGEKGIRFLLVSGKPIEEPVAWYGPIVMNTQEELRQASPSSVRAPSSSSGKRTEQILMPYPEMFVAPMREELTSLGVRELRTAADVDAAVTGTTGTLMIVVNSVCGCAAGKARPDCPCLRNAVKPDVVATVFAGADVDATDRARGVLYRPPRRRPRRSRCCRTASWCTCSSAARLKTGTRCQIAAELTSAFEKFCRTPTSA